MFHSVDAFEGARQKLVLQELLGGAPQEAVSTDEACAIEPALAPRREAFAGGIHTESECAVDCLKLYQSMVKILSARDVRWSMGQVVEWLVVPKRRLQAVQLRNGQDICASLRAEHRRQRPQSGLYPCERSTARGGHG